MSPKLAG
jgi:hypothetical protein